MNDEIEKFPIVRVTEQDRNEIQDAVAREFSLTVILNNQELVTLLCSPTKLDYLAIGFLCSEGLIKNKDEIRKIILDYQRGEVRVESEEGGGLARDGPFRRLIASGGGKGSSIPVTGLQAKINSKMELSAPELFALVKEFGQRSEVFKATGGVHSAALCDGRNVLIFSEDIGRHNAVDKIFGECLLKDVPTDDCLIILSGRVSSEMLLKVAKRNIPMLISVSAPTNLAVKLADRFGVTLIGFVRGEKANIYTHDWRVKGFQTKRGSHEP